MSSKVEKSEKVESPASQSTASFEEVEANTQCERAQTEESGLSLSVGDIRRTEWALGQKKQPGMEPPLEALLPEVLPCPPQLSKSVCSLHHFPSPVLSNDIFPTLNHALVTSDHNSSSTAPQHCIAHLQ